MDEKKRQKIEQVMKLLALAKSSNENEAMLAASRAREIMDKYNIVEMNLTESESGECKTSTRLESKIRHDSWEDNLFLGVAEANDCIGFTSVERIAGKYGACSKTRTHTFAGFESDVQVGVHMYNYLHYIIMKLGREHTKKMKKQGNIQNSSHSGRVRRSFCLGASVRITERLLERRKVNVQENGCTALVLNRKTDVDKWVNKTHNIKNNSKSSNGAINFDAYQSGARSANSIALNSSVNSGKSQKQLST